ncbi:hypothetical protein [Tomitella gaofuii]|uniref:hypothetical protein n=1 Tax=Tomitella gaofuii TaxID=2760083 RepID=UPI0015F7F66D|nr:hypothetical protein [Tomitella gaofuii]
MQDQDYTTADMAELVDIVAQTLAFRVLKDRVARAEKSCKERLDKVLPEGTKLVGQIAGVTLGSAWKSAPKKVAHIASEDQFVGYLEYKFEEELVTTVSIRHEDMSEVAAILADHGHEDLVQFTTAPPQWLRERELRNAVAGEDIPGVELREGKPVMSARPVKDADELVEQLIRDGHVDVATLALEAGR